MNFVLEIFQLFFGKNFLIPLWKLFFSENKARSCLGGIATLLSEDLSLNDSDIIYIFK